METKQKEREAARKGLSAEIFQNTDLQTAGLHNKKHSPAVKNIITCMACFAVCLSLSGQLCLFGAAVSETAAVWQEKVPDSRQGVTFEQLNNKEVFLKQSQARVCTLTASAMMVRRAAMLMGNADWKQITEQSVRKDAWSQGTGLKWNFKTSGISVTHKQLASAGALITLLNSHPEGVVIYNSRKPHAILITDYTDGIFYCSDPANDKPYGRYPVSQASITIESATRCWYVKQPLGLTVIGEGSASGDAVLDDAAGNDTDISAGNDTIMDTSAGNDMVMDASAGNDTVMDGSAGNDTAVDASAGNDTDTQDTDEKDTVSEDASIEDIASIEHKAGGMIYQILNKEEKTAACTGILKESASVTIPDTVRINGEEYKVIKIAENAFARDGKLKEIVIGANITGIDKKAFYQCKKLKTVRINARRLKEIGADAFAKIHKKAQILIEGVRMETFAALLSGTSVPQTVTVRTGPLQALEKNQEGR